MKQIIRTIVVEGSGLFPLDMLRYDQAWPGREADSITIHEHKGRRCVQLRSLAKAPTLDRWAGFGWRVVSATDLLSLPQDIRAAIAKNAERSVGGA